VFKRSRHRAGEAIKTRHEDHVVGTETAQQARQFAAVGARAARLLAEDLGRPSLVSSMSMRASIATVPTSV